MGDRVIIRYLAFLVETSSSSTSRIMLLKLGKAFTKLTLSNIPTAKPYGKAE
jgi:hypothetical protein